MYTRNITQDEQVIFIYLGIYVYICILYVIKLMKKISYEFEREQGCLYGRF